VGKNDELAIKVQQYDQITELRDKENKELAD
jgi:hypothetical protein